MTTDNTYCIVGESAAEHALVPTSFPLVQLALQEIAPPYGEDVIEEVCLVIENNKELFHKYLYLSDALKHWVVNNWIGQSTKEITGGRTLREAEARCSKLITGYTKLSFSPITVPAPCQSNHIPLH